MCMWLVTTICCGPHHDHCLKAFPFHTLLSRTGKTRLCRSVLETTHREGSTQPELPIHQSHRSTSRLAWSKSSQFIDCSLFFSFPKREISGRFRSSRCSLFSAREGCVARVWSVCECAFATREEKMFSNLRKDTLCYAQRLGSLSEKASVWHLREAHYLSLTNTWRTPF